MSEIQASRLLDQLRAMTSLASGEQSPAAANYDPGRPDFAALLRDSVDKVNEVQQHAASLATGFEAGDPAVDLTEVVIAMEKAGLSFQALTQVRNKLVSAYQEIMSMQV